MGPQRYAKAHSRRLPDPLTPEADALPTCPTPLSSPRRPGPPPRVCSTPDTHPPRAGPSGPRSWWPVRRPVHPLTVANPPVHTEPRCLPSPSGPRVGPVVCFQKALLSACTPTPSPCNSAQPPLGLGAMSPGSLSGVQAGERRVWSVRVPLSDSPGCALRPQAQPWDTVQSGRRTQVRPSSHQVTHAQRVRSRPGRAAHVCAPSQRQLWVLEILEPSIRGPRHRGAFFLLYTEEV